MDETNIPVGMLKVENTASDCLHSTLQMLTEWVSLENELTNPQRKDLPTQLEVDLYTECAMEVNINQMQLLLTLR